ncbi:MAG: M67 family metallopeptidase [Candidatus Heimdallarchaeota archaeon]
MSPSISIFSSCYQEIISLLKENQPIEVVGLVFGLWEPQNHVNVTDFQPMLNIDESPTRFSIDYEIFYQHIIKYEKEGRELVGIFHSHPENAQLAPSQQDIHYMKYWPYPYTWLIGGDGPDPELKAFALRMGKVIELPIRVI